MQSEKDSRNRFPVFDPAQTRFYENNNGNYVQHQTPFSATAQNLSNCWGDYDNDGDLDVVITADAIASKLYLNNGSLNFSSAINIGTSSSGVSNCDYDNDGDLDLFFNGQNAGRALFDNTNVNSNNWVNIKCTGVTSNKSSIGTLIKLKTTINGSSVWQIREINAQNSFQSQNDLRVHFGLGTSTIIDSIIFKFPSGQVDVISNVVSNQFYCHNEGSNNLCVLIGLTELDKDAEFSIYPNPTSNSISIQLKDSAKTIENISISDESGRVLLSSKQKAGSLLRIDIQKLIAGNYWLTVVINKKTISKAFIKI